MFFNIDHMYGHFAYQAIRLATYLTTHTTNHDKRQGACHGQGRSQDVVQEGPKPLGGGQCAPYQKLKTLRI